MENINKINVYVLTTDFIFTKQVWCDWEEKWKKNIPICLIETQIVGIVRGLDENIYAYEVKWWKDNEYNNEIIVKKFESRYVYFDKEKAIIARNEIWESKKQELESQINLIYCID